MISRNKRNIKFHFCNSRLHTLSAVTSTIILLTSLKQIQITYSRHKRTAHSYSQRTYLTQWVIGCDKHGNTSFIKATDIKPQNMGPLKYMLLSGVQRQASAMVGEKYGIHITQNEIKLSKNRQQMINGPSVFYAELL